ncbi:MAG: response regulator [Chloroflexota bacterium]|nr:MAG: response regulator [Chloroflexota bacterium]
MAKYRILLVDDQHEVRRMLRTGLESLGPEYSVTDMPSAEEALLVIMQQHFDLLVTDVRLPGMSGFEFMERVQKRNPGLKVILITGLTDPKIRRQVAEAGAHAFFIKPMELADFLDAVERILGAVQTYYPQEPILPGEPEQALPTLPERLSALRHDLRADAAVLFDDQGKVLAEAGDMPRGSADAGLISALTMVFSAGTRVSHALGLKTPESYFYFKGIQYNLTLAPVASSMALLTIHPLKGEFPGNIAKTVEPALKDLARIFEKTGTLPPPTKEAPSITIIETKVETGQEAPITGSASPLEEDVEVEISEEDINQVAALFGDLASKKLQPEDVDDFWDSAVDQTDPNDVGNARAISYDQARKLGLAPDEKEKGS